MNDIIVRDNAVPAQLVNSATSNLNRLYWVMSQDILPQQKSNSGINYDDNTFTSLMMVHSCLLYTSDAADE